MLKFLQFQFGLHDTHQFILDVSRKLFPHQEKNRDEMGRLIELYTADRITYGQMLADARQHAMN